MRERSPSRIPTKAPNKTKEAYFPMEGGMNIVDPPINLKAGVAINALNYEVDVRQGYRRIDGYERFDGNLAPSDARYLRVNFNSGGTTTLAVDATLTGDTSGATARVLSVGALTAGSWAGGNAAGSNLILDEITGTISAGENMSWTGTQANILSIVSFGTNNETNSTTHDAYMGSVTASRRSRISAVPGTGAVRGVTSFKGTVYAWRDGTDGAGHMYRHVGTGTAPGWVEVTAWATPIRFYNGTQQIDEGASVQLKGSGTTNGTGVVHRLGVHVNALAGTASYGEGYLFLKALTGTYTASGAWTDKVINDYVLNFDAGVNPPVANAVLGADTTAFAGTVRGFVVTSGTWAAAGTDAAAGYITISGYNGTAAANNEEIYMTTVTGDRVIVGNVNGTAEPVQGTAALVNGTGGYLGTGFSTNGTYRSVNQNFYGRADNERLYFVNGVDKHAWEFDGTTICPLWIFEEDADELGAPLHIQGHKSHLFLAYDGGTIWHSSLGDPFSFNPLTGSAELNMYGDVSAMEPEIGDVLAIICRNTTYLMYGTVAADFRLVRSHQRTGGIPDTVQHMGMLWFLDDRGVQTMVSSDRYGDFIQSTMSQEIWPLIDDLKDNIAGSGINKVKNQYRLFFDNKKALYFTTEGDQLSGIMPMLFTHTLNCFHSGEDANGFEWNFAGGADGFVYQLDKGYSFDGTGINSFLQTNYFHYGNPMTMKHFDGIQTELTLSSDIRTVVPVVNVTPSVGYGNVTEMPGGITQQDNVGFYEQGGLWNVDNWAEFNWSAPVFPYQRIRLHVRGNNISLIFGCTGGTMDAPHTLMGVSMQYRNQRMLR